MNGIDATPEPALPTRCACGHTFGAHDSSGCAACACRRFEPANDERPA